MAAFLIVVGGLAQILGVVLVALEYRDARKRVEDYVQRTRIIYASASMAIASAGSATATVTGPLGPPSPLERIVELEQRANALDVALAQARDEMKDRDDKLEARVAKKISKAIETTQKTIMGDVSALAELILGLNDERGHGRRVASVVLLIGGLAVATAGGLASLSESPAASLQPTNTLIPTTTNMTTSPIHMP